MDLELTQVLHDVDDTEDPDSDGNDIQAVLGVYSSETPAKIETFPLKSGRNVIGRAPTCDVMIDDKVVSKEHACIEVCKHDMFLWDLNSRNKTKKAQKTLVPEVRYNLDFGEDVFLGGLKVCVLEQSHLANPDDDHGSDTCSESLLTEAETMQDQRSSIPEYLEEPVTSQASTVVCSDPDEAPRNGTARQPGDKEAGKGNASTSKHCTSSTESQTQVSEIFTLPPMPNLDFTETQGSERSNTSHDESEAERDFREAATQAVPATPNRYGSPRSNCVEESGRTPVQAVADGPVENMAECGGDGDLNKGAIVCAESSGGEREHEEDEEHLNAPTQAFEECPDDPREVLDRLIAPTQGFVDEEHLNSPTRAGGDKRRLNAPTQVFEDDGHLSAPTQAYEDGCINAPTQAFEDDGCTGAPTQGFDDATDSDLDTGDENHFNAATQAYQEATNLNDEDELNPVMQTREGNLSGKNGFEDPSSAELSKSVKSASLKGKNVANSSLVKTPQPPASTRRHLLPFDTDPRNHDFVLCEASQPERVSDNDETDEDDFCLPTQPDPSLKRLKPPPLLMSSKRTESLDETPPALSQAAIEETPPSSPSLVPESDPEDESREAMVTASNSLVLSDETEALYQDCLSAPRPGSHVASLLGAGSSKGGISGSLKRTWLDAKQGTEGASSKRLQLEDVQEQSEPLPQSTEKAAASPKTSQTPSKVPENLNYTSTPCPSEASAGDSTRRGHGECSDEFWKECHLPRVSGVEPLSEFDAEEKSRFYEEAKELSAKACESSAKEVGAEAVESHRESEVVAHSEVSKLEDGENSANRQEGCEQGSSASLLPKSPTPQPDVDDDKGGNSSKVSRAEVKSRASGRKKRFASLKAPVDTAPVPPRSSSRRNAGSRMKEFLSIEKRTAASGSFRAEPTIQEKGKAASVGKRTSTADDATSRRSRRSIDKDDGGDAMPELGQFEKEPIAKPALHDADLSSTVPDGKGNRMAKVSSKHSWEIESQKLDAGASFDTCLSEPFPVFSELLRAGCAAEDDEPDEESPKPPSADAKGPSAKATALCLNTTEETQDANSRTSSPGGSLLRHLVEPSSYSFEGRRLNKCEDSVADDVIEDSAVSVELIPDKTAVLEMVESLDAPADARLTRSRRRTKPPVPSPKLKVALGKLDDTQVENVVAHGRGTSVCQKQEEGDLSQQTASPATAGASAKGTPDTPVSISRRREGVVEDPASTPTGRRARHPRSTLPTTVTLGNAEKRETLSQDSQVPVGKHRAIRKRATNVADRSGACNSDVAQNLAGSKDSGEGEVAQSVFTEDSYSGNTESQLAAHSGISSGKVKGKNEIVATASPDFESSPSVMEESGGSAVGRRQAIWSHSEKTAVFGKSERQLVSSQTLGVPSGKQEAKSKTAAGDAVVPDESAGSNRRRGRRAAQPALAKVMLSGIPSESIAQSSAGEGQEPAGRGQLHTRSTLAKAAPLSDAESQQTQSRTNKAPTRNRLAKKQAASAPNADEDDFEGLIGESAAAKKSRRHLKPTTAEADEETIAAGCSKSSRAIKHSTNAVATTVGAEAGGVHVTRCRKVAKKMVAPIQSRTTRKGKALSIAVRVTKTSAGSSEESGDDTSTADNDPGANRQAQKCSGRNRASVSFGTNWHPDKEGESSEAEEEPEPSKKQKRGRLPKKAAVKVEPDKVELRAGRGSRKRAGPTEEDPSSLPKVQRGTRKAAATGTASPSQVTKGSSRTKPKVMFTGLEDTSGERAVKSLGGTVAATTSACTHLVTDKFRRTVKALSCIAKGIPVVATSWLDKCMESGYFVDHLPFLLKDKAAERHLGFNLEETLRSASQRGILQGWSIHATPNVLPSPIDLKEIVGCAGGKYLARMPKRSGNKTVVISCQEDKTSCSPAAKAGIPVMTAEFVLSGLLQYRLDLKKHALS